MSYESRYRLARKEAVGMDELVSLYIKNMKLSSGLNAHRIYSAWMDVSGAAGYTLDRYYKDGTLYVRLSSSVARSALLPRREEILSLLNARLASDDLFDGENGYVKAIVLK